MEQINISKLTFKENCIKDYIKLLLDSNFKIFVFDKKNISWFLLSKNDKIGNCQYEGFIRGFSFSTKHKPNKNTGTGYQTETEVLNPTDLNAIGTFINYPNWENNINNKNSVVKYKDLKEYFKQENVLTFFEVLK